MSYFLMIDLKNSVNFYEYNVLFDFIIEFLYELELGEKWECVLIEINFNNIFEIL